MTETVTEVRRRAARARWDNRTPEQRTEEMAEVSKGRRIVGKRVDQLEAEVASLRAIVAELQAAQAA